jgi:hypothetical protein
MISQRKRDGYVSGQWFKAPKVPDPRRNIIIRKPDCFRPAVVAKPQDRFWKIRGLCGVTNLRAKAGDLWIGTVGGWERFFIHILHLGGA